MSTYYIKLKVIRWSVGPSVHLFICMSQWTVFLYNSYSISRIKTKDGIRVDISDSKNLLEGQGQWVKGQGQIRYFFDNLFGL